MERKKSKQAIAFPRTLDMDRFIKDPALQGDNTYQLRGVLLHKGQSAYHGHYEAQIFDVKYVNHNDIQLLLNELTGVLHGISSMTRL